MVEYFAWFKRDQSLFCCCFSLITYATSWTRLAVMPVSLHEWNHYFILMQSSDNRIWKISVQVSERFVTILHTVSSLKCQVYLFTWQRNICILFYFICGLKNVYKKMYFEIYSGVMDTALVLYVYISLCVCKLLSYQHDHTPVDDSSVVIVTTGWTQQGLLCLMTATEINYMD